MRVAFVVYPDFTALTSSAPRAARQADVTLDGQLVTVPAQ
jgi:hypothetical protein